MWVAEGDIDRLRSWRERQAASASMYAARRATRASLCVANGEALYGQGRDRQERLSTYLAALVCH